MKEYEDLEVKIKLHEEEIAEEFGVFHSVSLRDFFTYWLLKKAEEERENDLNKKEE
ncbi:hypothetical protein [Bacillus taeanensis]|uniref:hypothetical protein n=1 Tax=Bacillus taeanensis TaxID=273032 RepID=UPI0015F022EB|nr:hypothetical protein [Bacillus taeanensis]